MKKHLLLPIFGGLMLPLLFAGPLLAAPGTLDQAPLYVGPAVEPNIVILSDDSGSMDWEIMSRDLANSGRFTATQPDGTDPGTAGSVKHRDDDDDGTADCTFADSFSSDGYIYGVEFDSNSYFDMTDAGHDCRTADDEAWRFRNSDFNPLYFDPTKTYEPWKGANISGTPYANASIIKAPNDPYNPTEWINLTVHNSNLNGSTARNASDRNSDLIADGFRYYTWSDTDGDAEFDNGEETPYLIKNQDAATQQNFANWFTYHRSREFVAKYAISKAVEGMTGVRLGYGTINNNSGVNIKVASMNIDPSVGNKKALYDKLFQTDSTGLTPLRENLRNVGRYYECVAGNFYGVSGADCPILPAADFGQCQKNFTILMTDGFYNGSSPSVGNTDTDGADDFDGGNYADALSDTLADVAMDFYERDLRPLANEVPASGIDTATHQHMTTFTVAFGVTGDLDPDGTRTPSDATDTDPADAAFSWPTSTTSNASKIDDLWHAAFNGRGAFFSAQDPDALISAINSAVESASKGTSSSAAVAFNTTSLDTDSVVYQALFNPTEDWKGELIATQLNADGSIASSPYWNAGDQLNDKAHASREIITYKVAATPADSAGVSFKVLADLSTTQQADLNMGPSGADSNGQARLDYLRGDRSNESNGLLFRDRTNVLGDIVHSNPVFVGKPQMNYPDHNSNAAFGDATNYYSDFKITNTSRTGLIYIGANDGMLHAFHEDTGNEVFAYIPNMLFSNASGAGLHYLTDPGYTHRYYVDLSPTVSDVFFTRNSVAAWRTVVVGGLRAGGRGLFALDVTNPTALANADANADDIVLWEFTGDDDADLGYTMSKPTIAMMENDKWGVVFGNGYNGSGDGEAKLFILYLDQGLDGEWVAADYEKITTTFGTVAVPNGLSTPQLVDIDGNGKVDRAYAGDLEGNLWAFDLSSSSSAQWKIAYKQGPNPKPLFTATDAGGTAQPITSKPVVATQLQDTTNPGDPNLMIFFGTGQYIVNADKTSTGSQTFYGIWDHNSKELSRSDLLEQTFTADTTSENRVVTDTAITYGTNHGWFIDLPTTGERMVVNPKIRGKYVFFNTLIPGLELCVPEGSGWVMAVQQENGGQPDEPIFDINNDGVIDANDQINGNNPSGFKLDGIPAASTFLGDVMYTPNDEGNIDARKISVGGGGGGGRLSWQEITQ